MNVFGSIANAILFRGASGIGGAVKRGYRKKGAAGRRVSEKTLNAILRSGRGTEYGKKIGLDKVQSVEDYQRLVPLSTYEDYRSYVDRMVELGEQNLLTRKRVRYLAQTSGTVSKLKLIPQTSASYVPYIKETCILANDLSHAERRRGLSGVPCRGLLLTEVNISKTSGKTADVRGIRTGYISAYAVGGLKTFLPMFTCLPKDVIGKPEIRDQKYIKARYALQEPDLVFFGGVFMSALVDIMSYIEEKREMLIRDIETGTIDPSVDMPDGIRRRLEKKLRPDPARAAELRAVFDAPGDGPIIPRIWKNMSLIASVGTGDFTPFTEKMRGMAGDVEIGFLMYAASECVFGAAMETEQPQYLLLPDAGFFEFLPVDENGETDDSARPLLMHELAVGGLYEIIVTNRAGLYRYRIKDVVRVAGFEGEIPYVCFAYRREQVINMAGSHFTGEFIEQIVENFSEAIGVPLRDHSIYADYEDRKGRIVLYIEPDGEIPPDRASRLDDILEEEMIKVNVLYGMHRQEESINHCVVRRVAPGTYEHYRDMRIAQGMSVNQLKAVRYITTQEQYDFFTAAVIDNNA